MTNEERELADAALFVAMSVESQGTGDGPQDGYWAEELIPVEGEEADDVRRSALYGGEGQPTPRGGFTLWRGDTAYRVTVEKF